MTIGRINGKGLTPAKVYARAVADPEVKATSEEKFVFLLAMLDAVARREDPERTGPRYEPKVGEFPLGTSVAFPDEGKTRVGVVIEYADREETPRPHVLLVDDGSLREIPYESLTEQ
jgi:hypothetical protein